MIWIIIVLGIIEGLTEFIPVSSTGHLILANYFFNFEGDFANLFAIVIQTGAILAVVVIYWRKFFPKSLKKQDVSKWFMYWIKVVVAIIPIGLIGVFFSDWIKTKLFNPVFVGIMLIVGAVWILVLERRPAKDRVVSDDQITFKEAITVGLFQCLAVFPGMSRSASTIIGARTIGIKRSVAAEYSFFLAVPVLIGAGLVELIKTDLVISGSQWGYLLLGSTVSFIFAYIVIRAFIKYVSNHDFKVFAYYRIVLGIIILLSVLL